MTECDDSNWNWNWNYNAMIPMQWYLGHVIYHHLSVLSGHMHSSPVCQGWATAWPASMCLHPAQHWPSCLPSCLPGHVAAQLV